MTDNVSTVVRVLFAVMAPAGLSCCGSSSGTGEGAVINTYKAGIFPFGDAIDSHGNVWVANKGHGTPRIANVLASNVIEYMGAAKGPEYFPYSSISI